MRINISKTQWTGPSCGPLEELVKKDQKTHTVYWLLDVYIDSEESVLITDVQTSLHSP